MSRWIKGIIARLLVVSCLLLWGCFLVPSVNLTGTWTGTMEWTSGPKAGFVDSIVLTLEHEGRIVSGSVRLPSPGGTSFSLSITQGSTRNSDLFLLATGVNDQVPGNPAVEFRVDGEFDQATISGDGTQSIAGKVYSFNWQAVLSTEPVAETGL